MSDGNRKTTIFELMKKRLNLLIVIGIIVLLCLSAMQYYLVTTAYHYKVTEFRAEIKEQITKLTDDFENIDREIVLRKDSLYKDLAREYIADPRVRLHIRQKLIENKYRDEITIKLLREFKAKLPEYQIDFAVVLNKFVLYNESTPADTLYAEQPQIGNKIYGNLSTLENAFAIRSYVRTGSGAAETGDIRFLTEDALYVSVHNSEMIIFKRMAAILVFALLSILTLVTLFILAVRALIRQKKISDIKTDFINNITHELKTPLTTLSVSTQILKRDDIHNNKEAYMNILDTVSRQNTRLQQLIDQVMSNSLGSEAIELTKEKVNVNELLQTVVSDFKHTQPGIVIELNIAPTRVFADLDRFHLTTALLNVLGNAVKYGCSNITLSSRCEDALVYISIKDDGIGIKKSNHAHLFEKFYRVREGNLHTTKGLGLGLYYVDQILKAHSGSVKVASEPGHGAAFTFCLPV